MLNFFKSVFDWIFYKKCYFCGKISPVGAMCDDCYNNICIKSSEKYKYLNNTDIFSVTTYKNEVQKLIRGIKFHNKTEFAIYAAKILYDFWKSSPYIGMDFEIVPMPSHESRIKQRKYNHMILIANEFSKLTGYNVNTELVLKIKDTKPQYKLNKEQREDNLKNAFHVKKENYNGKNLLLIDDICTTGVTMQEMIKALNNVGIDKLCGLVLSNPE